MRSLRFCVHLSDRSIKMQCCKANHAANRHTALHRENIYILTINCNWAYARWQCLRRSYIQHGNSTYISRKHHNTSHVFAQYKCMNIHSTVQVHEHYKTQQKTENTEENKMNILPGNASWPSSLQLSLYSLSYPDPVCKTTSLRFTFTSLLHYISLNIRHIDKCFK
jgi:hypothetical protein